jgi:hypothetical protein
VEREPVESELELRASCKGPAASDGHVEKGLREYFLFLDYVDPAVHVADEKAARAIAGMNEIVDPRERPVLAARRHGDDVADDDRDLSRLNASASNGRARWRVANGARSVRGHGNRRLRCRGLLLAAAGEK